MKVSKWDGEKITEPGCYSHVPLEVYHGDICDGPSISSSGIKTLFLESPAHYWLHSPFNPERVPQKPSEPLLFGRGAHAALLGDENFTREFAIRPETYPDSKTGAQKPWSGNASWCIDWLAETEAAGLTVLTPGQLESIRGMAGGLGAHPMVRAGILTGLVEHSFFFKDEETGIWIKSRPDVIPTSSLDMADLKCVADVSDEAIENSIGTFGYNIQGAVVGMACRAVLKAEMQSFSLVLSEKSPPFCARVKTLKPADLQLGEMAVRASLRLFANCWERNSWPGPGGTQSDAEYVEMKPWHRKKFEDRLALMENDQ